MNKRYQVFVSSTFKDLAEERMEVVKALLELDCIPCGMEYFPAASEDSWSYISNLIKQCDYYVLIVAGKYGSITSEGISFTQKEYQYAVECGVPILVFVRADVESLPVIKVDTEPLLKQKLDSFVNLLKANNLCKEWHNADDLGAVVSRGVTQLTKRVPRLGWVRADELGYTNAEQVLELTRTIEDLKKRLEKYECQELGGMKLADGDELFEVEYLYAICYYAKNEKSGWRETKVRSRVNAKVSLSWNEIFSVVAPKISVGASPEGVRKCLVEYILHRNPATLEKSGDFVSESNIESMCFDKIKVQFEALRLLTARREEIGKNKAKLIKWHLTDWGRQRMVEIMAVRSTKTRSQNS